MTWGFWGYMLVFGGILYVCTRNWRKDIKAVPSRNNRWQARYASLTKNFDPKQIEPFYKKICKLAARYHQPSAARSIYFQAHQFTAKHHGTYSLIFYLHYLHVETSSATFRHRRISDDLKTILFRNKMQEARFLEIGNRLKENRNLNQAIDDTKLLFRMTRREIRLDVPEIREVSREQSQTAELLGKYLEDDTGTMPETTTPAIVLPANNSENTLFQLFEQNNFVLNKKEIDTFARNNGMFCDSLIQQINETYYETVDDVLIEDEGDSYTLNQAYYEQIKECL